MVYLNLNMLTILRYSILSFNPTKLIDIFNLRALGASYTPLQYESGKFAEEFRG